MNELLLYYKKVDESHNNVQQVGQKNILKGEGGDWEGHDRDFWNGSNCSM